MVWVREEKGQTMAEYGLILALVAVVVITAITLLGNNITTFFTDLAGNF
jgi:pilus assembly protein Flp/PilA